jgi:CRISPR/Cas system endoribonuclease Cas6 (RAMP superfamily)
MYGQILRKVLISSENKDEYELNNENRDFQYTISKIEHVNFLSIVKLKSFLICRNLLHAKIQSTTKWQQNNKREFFIFISPFVIMNVTTRSEDLDIQNLHPEVSMFYLFYLL